MTTKFGKKKLLGNSKSIEKKEAFWALLILEMNAKSTA